MLKGSESKYLAEIKTILCASDTNVLSGLNHCCSYLRKTFDHFDWVGFYFSDFSTKTLKLVAYSGAPTNHTSIPFGKGICGQVALSNKNFLVPNVQEQDNYIPCSFDVSSEIVIPLFVDGKNIGQIDVDSHKINAFSNKDELFLVACCNLISKIYGHSLLSL